MDRFFDGAFLTFGLEVITSAVYSSILLTYVTILNIINNFTIGAINIIKVTLLMIIVLSHNMSQS